MIELELEGRLKSYLDVIRLCLRIAAARRGPRTADVTSRNRYALTRLESNLETTSSEESLGRVLESMHFPDFDSFLNFPRFRSSVWCKKWCACVLSCFVFTSAWFIFWHWCVLGILNLRMVNFHIGRKWITPCSYVSMKATGFEIVFPSAANMSTLSITVFEYCQFLHVDICICASVLPPTLTFMLLHHHLLHSLISWSSALASGIAIRYALLRLWTSSQIDKESSRFMGPVGFDHRRNTTRHILRTRCYHLWEQVARQLRNAIM